MCEYIFIFFKIMNWLFKTCEHVECVLKIYGKSWLKSSVLYLVLSKGQSYCCERPRPRPLFMMWGQIHMNGWSCVIASQNGGLTDYIFPLRLRVLQWSHHLFNYWKNKKTIIEKFLILLIWNLIYIDYRKITWLWS